MIEWVSEEDFRIDGTDFACCPPGRTVKSSADRFMLQKASWAVEAYAELLDRLAPKRILELGVLEGGSVALLALLARPEKLVAADISPGPVPALEEFVQRRSLEDVVAVHFGVDQADREALAGIVTAEFGDSQLDLIIDDASHDLDRSRASFDALFPTLRPGGLYVLEDWSWAHAPVPVWTDQTPLSVMVFELAMASVQHGLIAGMEINRGWAIVERGPEPLPFEEGAFALSALYNERGRELIPALTAGDPPRRGGLAARIKRLTS